MSVFLGVDDVRSEHADLKIRGAGGCTVIQLPWADAAAPDRFSLPPELENITLATDEAPSTDEQTLMRRIALGHNGLKEPRQNQVDICRAWVELLLASDRRTEQLIQIVRLDAVFYAFPGTSSKETDLSKRRPRKKNDRPEQWRKCLSFLHHPENLSIPELELALAVFDWNADKPGFNPWIAEFAPDLLPRIHQFLLRHYSHELLAPFSAALKSVGRNRPPYRAGEVRGIHLRMMAMTAVGMMALFGAQDLWRLFEVKHAGQALLIAIVLLASSFLLRQLLYWEIFRQNHGFLAHKAHARPRFLWLFQRVLLYGFLLAAAADLFLWLQHVNPGELLQALHGFRPGPLLLKALKLTAYRLLHISACGVFAAVLGVMLQSLWDSHSVIDAD